MKKTVLLLAFLVISFIGSSQIMRTEKVEIYLAYIEVNEVNIQKSMGMTGEKQYFYEGDVEVNFLENNTSKKYKFYFATWSNVYKEFLVKDVSYTILQPEITFNNNDTAIMVKDNKVAEFKLKNNSNIDNAVLSNMLIWLENK